MTEKLRELLGRLSLIQKIQIGVAAVGTVALVWGLSTYATRTRYSPLGSTGSLASDSEVATYLDEQGIPYRIGNRGIEVPTDRRREIDMKLAGEGIPTGGGINFSIFSQPNFGMSNEAMEITRIRALENELKRTIETLDTVKSARVHLALPEESPFAGETNAASASVTVGLKGSGPLPREQVNAITYLVAQGIPRLEPSQVSVIDERRGLISEAGDAGAVSHSQIEARREAEREIEHTVIAALEPVVGVGNVRAEATVELENRHVQRTEERFDPEGAVVRSEQKEKGTQVSGGRGGVPGAEANLPETGGRGGGDRNQDERSSSRTEFDVSKTISRIEEPSGTILRQSVSVFVDHAREEQTDADGEATVVAVPRSEEQMRQLRDAAASAIGLDEGRGDRLVVQNAPFERSPTSSVESGGVMTYVGTAIELVRGASLPLAVLLVALFVIRPGIRALGALKQSESQTLQLPSTIGDLQSQLGASGSPEMLSMLLKDALPLRRKLIEAATEDPHSAALVVKGWLTEPARSKESNG